MPETITYEIVGNYICRTQSDLMTFTPIITPGSSFTFHNNPVDGMSIGGLKITGHSVREGVTVIVKPSYQEFKDIILRKIKSIHNGGSSMRKTRRN